MLNHFYGNIKRKQENKKFKLFELKTNQLHMSVPGNITQQTHFIINGALPTSTISSKRNSNVYESQMSPRLRFQV